MSLLMKIFLLLMSISESDNVLTQVILSWLGSFKELSSIPRVWIAADL